MNHRPLVRRHVRLRVEQHHVVGGVVRPGPAHAKIEIQAVHLRAHEMPVDPLLERPRLNVHCIETGAQLGKTGLLRGHGLGRVLRNPVDEGRRFERPPVLEQRQ